MDDWCQDGRRAPTSPALWGPARPPPRWNGKTDRGNCSPAEGHERRGPAKRWPRLAWADEWLAGEAEPPAVDGQAMREEHASARRRKCGRMPRSMGPKRAMLALARQGSTLAALTPQMPARDESGSFFEARGSWFLLPGNTNEAGELSVLPANALRRTTATCRCRARPP